MRQNDFAGSIILSRFTIRKDKFRLLVWLLMLSAFFVCFIPVFKNMFSSTDPAQMAVTVAMMKNPAMIAIVGPVYGAKNYTTGAMFANFMLVFSGLCVGIMNIFIVTRNTRHDEELGRLELIRSLPVGRLGNLWGTLSVAYAVNVILAILTAFGAYVLREDGMDLEGCLLLGIGIGVTGMLFAAATAVFGQLTANGRTATSLSFGCLMLFYLLRAIGDIRTEALSFISPLGLLLRTKVFVSNQWWPIGCILLETLVITLLSMFLANKRDLGRGMIPEKPGRRHGSSLMHSPYGLAFKLLRTSLIVWVLTLFLFAGMYGSVFGDLESFLSKNEMLNVIFSQNPNYSAVEQFISLLMVVMSLIAAIPILNIMGRVGGEEKKGHDENIFGKSVSRCAQMAAYLLPAVVMSIVFQLSIALGFWGVGSSVLKTTPDLGVFIKSALLYLPPLFIMIGLSMVITAFLPRKTYFVYVYLVYTFLAVYMGAIVQLPKWTTKLTPFGYIPKYPIEKISAAPLVVQLAIAIVLCILGFMGYQRRDCKRSV